jgi:hypothetical protein
VDEQIRVYREDGSLLLDTGWQPHGTGVGGFTLYDGMRMEARLRNAGMASSWWAVDASIEMDDGAGFDLARFLV